MSPARRLLRRAASLEATLVLLLLLMALVVLCTLDQVRLGTELSVAKNMRRFWVFWSPQGASWRVPVFPGGATLGALLLANLLASALARLELSRSKAGLWLVHAGLFLLVAGEFLSGAFQEEGRMALEEGRSLDYVESWNRSELALIDATGSGSDEVYSVPEGLLREGAVLSHPRWPFTLLLKRYHPNAALEPAGEGLPSLALSGPGKGLRLRPLPPETSGESPDRPAAYVEAAAQDRLLGSWLLSPELSEPQGFAFRGRRYFLALRPKRTYLPFTLTLKDFSHDKYQGTDIPRNFSSLLRLLDARRGEDRDVLISMNNPLRYDGKSFYQASFGKDDTLSVLQVVENPGRRLPYLACALVALGLLYHFWIIFKRRGA